LAIAKGHGAVWLWVTWGTGVFIVGWVGGWASLSGSRGSYSSLAADTNRIHWRPRWRVANTFSNLLARILDPQVHYAPFSLNDLSWPAAAFVIAAATTALVPIPA
jgi:hypothetical protein